MEDCELCDCCGGFLVLLGTLGDLEHYYCRDCGAEWSRPANEEGYSE